MDKQQVVYKDLGIIDYKSAWDYQEELVSKNREIKSKAREATSYKLQAAGNDELQTTIPIAIGNQLPTTNYLLFCEHPAVYTLGKSGSMKNVLH